MNRHVGIGRLHQIQDRAEQLSANLNGPVETDNPPAATISSQEPTLGDDNPTGWVSAAAPSTADSAGPRPARSQVREDLLDTLDPGAIRQIPAARALLIMRAMPPLILRLYPAWKRPGWRQFVA